MGIFVTEDLHVPRIPFCDPNALLSCDNFACDSLWVTGDGLVCWVLAEEFPTHSRFTDHLVIACNAACLRAAQERRDRRLTWSEPMPVRTWLRALTDSIELDPNTTPIGELCFR